MGFEEKLEEYKKKLKRLGGAEAYAMAGEREEAFDVAATLAATQMIAKCAEATIKTIECLLTMEKLAKEEKWEECEKVYVELSTNMGKVHATCETPYEDEQMNLLLQLRDAIEAQKREEILLLTKPETVATKWKLWIEV